MVVTLAGDTFAADLTGDVVVTNVPTGLTANLVRDTATQVSLTLTGTAGSHADADDIANLSVQFLDSAFVTNAAAGVTGAVRSDLVVDYANPAPVAPVETVDEPVNTSSTTTTSTDSGSSDSAATSATTETSSVSVGFGDTGSLYDASESYATYVPTSSTESDSSAGSDSLGTLASGATTADTAVEETGSQAEAATELLSRSKMRAP